MAKKSKRRSRARAASKRVQTPAAAQPAPAADRLTSSIANARPAPAAAERASAARTADLAQEYRYVIGDLKRIGILAASMFALLVVLALVAQYVF